MATYVNDLRLKEIATGDESGTWGTSTNTNLELIGEALGYGTQNCFSTDADATTTVADGATDPARAMYFKVTSSATLTATRVLTIAPNTISRVMFIENATTGSQSITISQGSGANVTIATGKTKVVYLDGAGATAAVVDALALVDPGVTDTLAEVLVAGNTSGGTGLTMSSGDDLTLTGASYNAVWDSSADSLAFADNAKATFGAGSDLQIYHDGGNTFINEGGTGSLYIQARDLYLRDYDTSVSFINMLNNGAVTLHYAGNAKLATTSTGIDVTGTVTADGGLIGDAVSGSLSQTGMLTVSDTNTTNTWTNFTGTAAYLPFEHELAVVNLADATTNSFAGLYFMAGETSAASGISSARIGAIRTGASTADLAFSTRGGGDMDEAMRITSTGNVGIGTTTPDNKFHVVSGAAGEVAQFTGAVEARGLSIRSETNTDASAHVVFNSQSGGSKGMFTFETDGTERMRIDSSGNVGIGTSSVKGKANIVISQADTASASDTTLANSFLQLGGGEYGAGRYFLTTYGYSTSQTNSGAYIGALGASSSGYGKYHLVFGTRDVTTDTAPTERMRIDSAGNVGINTTPKAWTAFNPVLQIKNASTGGGGALAGTSADNFRMFANTYYDGAYKRLATGFATQYGQESGAHVWSYAASGAADSTFTWSEAMRIDASGNLLVGTTTVNGTGITLGVGNYGYFSRSGDAALFVNRSTSDGDIVELRKADVKVGSIGTLSGNASFGSGDVHLNFNANDNIIEPMSTVAGGASDGAIDLGQSLRRFKDLYLSDNVKFNSASSAVRNDGGELYLVANSNIRNQASVHTFSNSAGSSEYARIDSSGNLLVGKAASSVAGQSNSIQSNTMVSASGPLNSHTSSKGVLEFSGNKVSLRAYGATAGTGFIAFTVGGGGGSADFEAARIDSSGNLLVGTTSAAATAGIGTKIIHDTAAPYISTVGSSSTNGVYGYYLYSTGAGAFRCYIGYGGTIYATSTSITAISDASLKENVRDLDKGLDTVLALKPRRFDWKNGDGNDIMGFVAQEVQEVLPELVHDYQYNETETKLGLKMGDMLPSLVKAIQEQQDLIESLTARIAALEGAN